VGVVAPRPSELQLRATATGMVAAAALPERRGGDGLAFSLAGLRGEDGRAWRPL